MSRRRAQALRAIVARDDGRVTLDLVELIDQQQRDQWADELILQLSRSWLVAELSRGWSPLGAPSRQSMDEIEDVLGRLTARKGRNGVR